MPLRREYTVPPPERLGQEHAFLIGLANSSEVGVVMQPLGYELFTYTEEDMDVDWK